MQHYIQLLHFFLPLHCRFLTTLKLWLFCVLVRFSIQIQNKSAPPLFLIVLRLQNIPLSGELYL